MVNVAFPSNAKFFLGILREIVTFDMLPSDFISEDLLDFSDTLTDPLYYDSDIF